MPRQLKSLSFGIVLLVSGADAAAMSMEDVASLTSPDRQVLLESGVRREGAVTVIGGLGQDMRIALLDPFMKKYPFIKAEGQRLGSAPTLQRILAEQRAKMPRTDLVVSSLVVELKQVGIVQPFRSPIFESFLAELQEPDHMYGSYRLAYHGIAYNTNMVSELSGESGGAAARRHDSHDPVRQEKKCSWWTTTFCSKKNPARTRCLSRVSAKEMAVERSISRIRAFSQ